MTAEAKLKIVNNTEFLPDEKLRKWFEDFIAENQNLNTTILSRSDHTGVSRTALDAYLDGTYLIAKKDGGEYLENPANSNIEDRLRAYKNRVAGTERHGYTNEFIKTTAWKQFRYACNTAIEENAIVVIYGEPGVGKSRCLQKYQTNNLVTSPMKIPCSANTTTRYFVRKIAKELKLSDKLPTAELEDLIVEKLRKSSRPLFVDQANYLNEKALGSICYIWEEARRPIVLIGTNDLFDLFNKSTLTQDVRVQLNSRVAWHCQLKLLTLEEIKTICVGALGEHATTQVVEKIVNITHGNHRHLNMIIPRVIASINANQTQLKSGAELIDVIEQASSRIMVG